MDLVGGGWTAARVGGEDGEDLWKDATGPALTVPKAHPRRPITVYECDSCGNWALGEQRCPDCSTFMRKIGLGGECPHCGEALAVTELLAQEVIAAD